VSGGTYIKGLI